MSQYTFTREEQESGWITKIKAILTGKKLESVDFVKVGDIITNIEGGAFEVIEVKPKFVYHAGRKHFNSYTAILKKIVPNKNSGDENK